MGTSAAKQAKTHQAIPWAKIQKRYEAGVDMAKIGQEFGYFDAKATDKTHEIRGISSRGVNTGYTGSDGKTVWFDKKARTKARDAKGLTDRGPKASGKKVAKVKAPKVAKTKAVKAPKVGKSIAIVMEEGGGFVRITGANSVLMKAELFLGVASEIVNQLGYKIEKLEAAELPLIEGGGETVQAPAPTAEPEAVPVVDVPVASPEAVPAEQTEAPEPVAA